MTEGLPGPPIDTGGDPIKRRVILPRWVKAMVAFSTVLAALAILVSASLFAANRQVADDNCARIHRIVVVGGEIIGDPARPDQAKAQRQLERWRTADCPSRSEPKKIVDLP